MKTVTFNPATHAILSIDPTNEMTSKMADALEDPENDRSSWDLAENMFRAMIAAAPEYPADAANPCIDELLSSVKALVKCKGRFHTQQNFERLALAYKNFEAGNSSSLPPAPEAV